MMATTMGKLRSTCIQLFFCRDGLAEEVVKELHEDSSEEGVPKLVDVYDPGRVEKNTGYGEPKDRVTVKKLDLLRF